jgi:endonuclease G
MSETATFLEARQPVIFPRLDRREGYKSKFLELASGEGVPLPELTPAGTSIAALLDDGSPELKYHKFSVVMHKRRRLALFAASNVDYRDKVRKINGRKPSREELNGFVTNTSELWITDERIPENQQLPDRFFTRDGGAFDRGHIVRRDDVCWGKSFKDMQKANGDTFHTTNCSPQAAGFNQSKEGEDNWGDLENMIQKQTRSERVIIFAGPVLDDERDQWFDGVDQRGEVQLQIPSRYWKIVVAKGTNGPEAYGFVLEQDLTDVPLEFGVPVTWRRYLERIERIESMLFGLARFEWLKQYDQYDAVRAHG